jgi:multiple sugar transport system permease protein
MKEERLKFILVLSGAIFMVSFFLIPIFYMVLTGFSLKPDFLSHQTHFQFTFENYRSVLGIKSLHFMDYLLNSIIVSGITAFFCVWIAGLAAYAITRLAFPGKMFLLLFVLAISMFPQISLVGYIYKLLEKVRWINTYKGLILPYIAWILPLSLWILVSYFTQIPRELDKAALIDGCTNRQVLQRIIFPIAAPGLFSTALLAFIFAFNEFMFALMLTIDHRARTIPVGIALFQGLHGEIPWGTIMAASTISILPVVILILFFQRHIIEGLTRGAVKG